MKKEDLLKENYKSENLIIRSEKTYHFDPRGDYNMRNGYQIYEIEDKLTDEEKLEIIDSHTDRLGTYVLNLIDKYIEDKNNGTIRTANWGNLHMGSLKSWIKKNDKREVMTRYMTSAYGRYNLFGTWYRMTKNVPVTEFGYKMLYDGEPIVRSWFHNLLNMLKKEEDTYFLEHDESEVLKTEIRSLIDKVSRIHYISVDLDSMSKDKLEELRNILKLTVDVVETNLKAIDNVYRKGDSSDIEANV